MDRCVNLDRTNTVEFCNLRAFGPPLISSDMWKKPKTTATGSIFEMFEPFEDENDSIKITPLASKDGMDRVNLEAFCEPAPVPYDSLDTLRATWWVFNEEKIQVVSAKLQVYESSNGVDAESINDKFLEINTQFLAPPKPQKRIGCRCGMSRCLRLHCRCFRDLEYCLKNCRCADCLNREAHDQARSFVIQKTKEINPLAFTKKLVYLDHGKNKINSDGCNCKTGCSRNYCECFKSKTGCSALCKCQNCQNSKLPVPETQLKSMFSVVSRNKNKIVIEHNLHHDSKSSPNAYSPPESGLRDQFANISNTTQESLINAQEELTKRSRLNSCVITYQNYKKVKVEELSWNSNSS